MFSMPLTIIDCGSVADWVSGIGSLAAAVVALYVAHSSQRVKIKGYFGRVFVNLKPQNDMLVIAATNVSQRATAVANITFSHGYWRWKQSARVEFRKDMGDKLPAPITDGESGRWYIPMENLDQWVGSLIDTLNMTRLSVVTFRVEILTTNGGKTTVWPEKGFRDILETLVKEKNNAKALTE